MSSSNKVNWIDIVEDLLLYCFCIYRISMDCFEIVVSASDTHLGLSYAWIFDNYWAELDAAIAIMALMGIATRRRFVFSFTALFFVLHTMIALSACAHNLAKLFQRIPIWSEDCYDSSANMIPWCRVGDSLYVLLNFMATTALGVFATTVCIQLLYVNSNKKQELPSSIVSTPRRPIIRGSYPMLIPLNETSTV